MNGVKYKEVKQVLISGDIHGDFEWICKKISEYEQVLLIVAGDCGLGFETMDKTLLKLHNLSKKYLSKHHNEVAFVRGNHDNPDYFKWLEGGERTPLWLKRFKTIPDYTVIEAAGRQILCVGGAVSVDRLLRQKWMERDHISPADPFDVSYYRKDEPPRFQKELLVEICNPKEIDAVVTHTAPSFCDPWSKEGLKEWSMYDDTLVEDVFSERKVMDEVFCFLKDRGMTPKSWHYGHYHFSHWRDSEGCRFRLLDIYELDSLDRVPPVLI